MSLITTTYITPENKKTAEDYLKEALEAELAAAKSSAQESAALYESRIPGIDEYYDGLASAAYKDLLAGQRASANELAGAGLYDSGYADTFKIAQRLAYKNELGENEKSRAGAISDIRASADAALQKGEQAQSEINARYSKLLSELYTKNEENERKDAQTSLQNAYSAAELGDFSALEALGIDTSAAKKLYDAKLYSALNSAMKTSSGSQNTAPAESGLDALHSELAVSMAKSFVENYAYGQNMPFSQALDFIIRGEDYITEKYGAAFYKKYAQTILENYPGSSAYTGSGESYLSSVESIMSFINNKNNMHRFYTGGGYNRENIAALIAGASLSKAEKKELYNYYGISADIIKAAGG